VQHLKNVSSRLRPALDLLQAAVAAVPNKGEAVESVLDLGCGSGALSKFLCDTFPNAIIDSVDSSPQMLDAAVKEVSTMSNIKDRVRFKLDSVENFAATVPSKKYDVVFSNSALHWIPPERHSKVFPQLIKNLLVPKNGVLAVQMPDTKDQASHSLIEVAALRTGLVDHIGNVRTARVAHSPLWYHHLLSPICRDVDMWTTEYVQQLPHVGTARQSTHPVLEYTLATALLPYLAAFGGPDSPNSLRFLAEYERLLKDEYPQLNPQNANYKIGKLLVLFPFKRFFLVAQT
jgi:trans-aconitate 2-methyltransferase